MWPSRGTRLGAVAAVLVFGGCDDPTLLRPAPETVDALVITSVLDPDSSTQALVAEPIVGTFGGWFRIEVRDETGALVATETHDSVSTIPDSDSEEFSNDWLPCVRRFGDILSGRPACYIFDFRPEYGARYRIRVSAEGFPAAEAETHVPGEFELLEVETSGHPPGTKGLYARWSRSEGAYRYIVAVRSQNVVCYSTHGCLKGWYQATDATEIRAEVPATDLEAGTGPWYVDVYALDRALYEYLTTGSGGELFAVPPLENVEGGYGVVGSWLRRSKAVGY